MTGWARRTVTVPPPDDATFEQAADLADAVTDMLRKSGRKYDRCIHDDDGLTFPIAARSEHEAVRLGQQVVDAQWALDSDPELSEHEDRRQPML